MCECIKLETLPFVCIFNGSRFPVSQGCGGGAGTFLSHSWSGAFIFMRPAALEKLTTPPPSSTPQHVEAGGGFEVDSGWVGFGGY